MILYHRIQTVVPRVAALLSYMREQGRSTVTYVLFVICSVIPLLYLAGIAVGVRTAA